MSRKSTIFALASTLLAALAAPVAALAVTTYTLVDLGPGPNGKDAYGNGANNSFQAGTFLFEHLSCGRACTFPVYHAVTWTGGGSTPVDITPSIQYFPEAWGNAAAGQIIVGTGITNNGGYFGFRHALLWHGSPLAWKDINPTGAGGSNAYATDGFLIAGSASVSGLHAVVWQLGQLKTPIDLHPASGYTSSEAMGVHGRIQVGYAMTDSTTPTQHAMLWRGSAASAVDLTPANVTGAFAVATDGYVEAGYGVVAPATANHALLWRNNSSRMKDLNPSGFMDSYARAVHGGVQVGYGHTAANVQHALVWKGSAASAVDLQLSMPTTYTSSQALGIDANGDIIGAAFYSSSTSHAWHAVMWIPQATR